MLQEQVIPEHSLVLLREISPVLADEGFYLAGGTALALRLGHRVSVDLDFFRKEAFDPSEILSLLKGIAGDELRIVQQTGGSLCLFMKETKVEVFHYSDSLLSPVEVIDGVTLSSMRDNVAMKLSAVMNRGTQKDFVDVASLLDEYSLEVMLAWFTEKYPQSEILMVLKSLSWFNDAEAEPDPAFLKGQDWEGVKIKILRELAFFSH
jgi:predicted nucleotidyltransferase component of viral defense system